MPTEPAGPALARYTWLIDGLRARAIDQDAVEAGFAAAFLSKVPPSDLLAWLTSVAEILTSSAKSVDASEYGIHTTYSDVVVLATVEESPPHRFTGLGMKARDWVSWHRGYDDPESGLSRRLRVVQHHVSQFLDSLPARGAQVISACAGEGRDILDVLAAHPRGDDVTARLVELDPRNVARAEALVRGAGLTRVEVLQGDAGVTDSYVGVVPADLLLVCGVFGNITLDDIENTIRQLRSLSARGATVIWTRHPREPGVIDRICEWFADEEFELLDLEVPGDRAFGVGVHRLAGEPLSPRPGVRLFSFLT